MRKIEELQSGLDEAVVNFAGEHDVYVRKIPLKQPAEMYEIGRGQQRARVLISHMEIQATQNAPELLSTRLASALEVM